MNGARGGGGLGVCCHLGRGTVGPAYVALRNGTRVVLLELRLALSSSHPLDSAPHAPNLAPNQPWPILSAPGIPAHGAYKLRLITSPEQPASPAVFRIFSFFIFISVAAPSAVASPYFLLVLPAGPAPNLGLANAAAKCGSASRSQRGGPFGWRLPTCEAAAAVLLHHLDQHAMLRVVARRRRDGTVPKPPIRSAERCPSEGGKEGAVLVHQSVALVEGQAVEALHRLAHGLRKHHVKSGAESAAPHG
mmetsp:Transcript_22172/g.50170  ORF Transcript_22172/g.50170 Transcript_22172/m.50170 type:complete len:248 (+) Transcript_22172:968-1711(+)